MQILRAALAMTLFLSPVLCSAQSTQEFVGTWEGKTKIRSVLLKLEEHGDTLGGTLTLFSLDGQKQESSVMQAAVAGKTLTFVSADMDFTVKLTGLNNAVLHGKRRELDIEFHLIREPHAPGIKN